MAATVPTSTLFTQKVSGYPSRLNVTLDSLCGLVIGTFRTGLSISVILTRLAIMGVYSLTARCARRCRARLPSSYCMHACIDSACILPGVFASTRSQWSSSDSPDCSFAPAAKTLSRTYVFGFGLALVRACMLSLRTPSFLTLLYA